MEVVNLLGLPVECHLSRPAGWDKWQARLFPGATLCGVGPTPEAAVDDLQAEIEAVQKRVDSWEPA